MQEYFTKSIDKWDRSLEEDNRAHNDHHPLHTIADRMGNRGYPLQNHVRNLHSSIRFLSNYGLYVLKEA